MSDGRPMCLITFHVVADVPVIESWPPDTDEATVKARAKLLGAPMYTIHTQEEAPCTRSGSWWQAS